MASAIRPEIPPERISERNRGRRTSYDVTKPFEGLDEILEDQVLRPGLRKRTKPAEPKTSSSKESAKPQAKEKGGSGNGATKVVKTRAGTAAEPASKPAAKTIANKPATFGKQKSEAKTAPKTQRKKPAAPRKTRRGQKQEETADDNEMPTQLPTPESSVSDAANSGLHSPEQRPVEEVTKAVDFAISNKQSQDMPGHTNTTTYPDPAGMDSRMSPGATVEAVEQDFPDDSSVLSSVPDDLDEQNPFPMASAPEVVQPDRKSTSKDPDEQNPVPVASAPEVVQLERKSTRKRRSTQPIERFGQLIETTQTFEEDVPSMDSDLPAHVEQSYEPDDEQQPATRKGYARRKRKASAVDADDQQLANEDASAYVTLHVGRKKLMKEETRRKSLMEEESKRVSQVIEPMETLAAPKASRSRKRTSAAVEEDAWTPDSLPEGPEPPSTPVAKKPRSSRKLTSTVPASTRKPRTISKRPTTRKPRQSTAAAAAGSVLARTTPEDPIEDALESDILQNVDPNLVAISQKLCTRRPIPLKPEPQGQPEVWADTRQALNETVPYFKVPQSGCHSKDRHVYAFMFDGISHCREYMDTDVIIARAGGAMESNGPGQMIQGKDHKIDDTQAQGVINDIQLQNPLVIICGNKHAGAICRMPHKYNILGWHKPIAVWSEKTLGKGGKIVTTVKYRFERLNGSGSAWHAPKEAPLSSAECESVASVVKHTCVACGQLYPTVYLNGWTCLNSSCERFWKLLSTSEDAPYGKLLYDPAFLLDRTPWANEEEPYSVRPPVPDVGNVVGDNLTHINTRGICCPECGRCNQRRLFKGWTCDNPNCTYRNFPKHLPVKPPMLHKPWESIGDGPALTRNKHEEGVNVTISHRLGFKVFTYTFDSVEGKLVHAVSNAKINRGAGGPDEMFAAMQQQDDPAMDLHLERRKFGKSTKAENPEAGPAPAPLPTVMSTSQSVPVAVSPMRKEWQDLQQDQQAHALNFEGLRETVASTLFARFAQAAQRPTAVQGDEMEIDQEDARVETMLNSAQRMFDQEEEPSQEPDNMLEPEPEPEPEPASTQVAAKDDDTAYMSAFAINYGMPYKFVASGASLPFQGSPWPIQACRADLNWASQNLLSPEGHSDLNELLIFAYLEGQKVDYHDDGESGLGPRIATMSLGGKAKMYLRIKAKHYVGCSKTTGVFTPDRPVPGTLEYEKRLEAWEQLQKLKKEGSKQQYELRRKQIPKELGIYENRRKNPPDLVELTLNHGDIVLMEGRQIQQYLEHSVVPEGCLRFAMTCRTVEPEHLKPHELPSYTVEPGDPAMSSLFRNDQAERAKAAQEQAAPVA